MARSLLLSGAVFLLPAPALADPPLSYLTGFGEKAISIASLTRGLFVISVAVIIIITALVLLGISLRRVRGAGGDVRQAPVARGGNGLSWLYGGVGISTIVLLVALVWTVIVIAAVASPPRQPGLTIEITGQQWWWKARYLSDDPSQVLTTANEIHIPVGEPVRVQLLGADVIHSFWVPALTGKTDTIPGQRNLTWLEADRPGRYMGQCTEYCGVQHAHMAFLIVAEPQADFEAWLRSQLAPAVEAASPAAARGEGSFVFHCGACHTVRGTAAGGSTGPDLTHLMSRSTLAAGTLVNNVGNLSGWIANPQAIKPGTTMPVLYLPGPELADIRSFLETLK